MVAMGLLLSDVPTSVPPSQQFRDVVRIAHEAQDAGFTYIVIGQHFLYGDLRWLQPVPLLARLAAEVNPDVRLATQIMIAPLYHPVMLAEELATLDVVTEGRLIFGAGLGYRAEEFDYLGIPFKERAGRMNEILELLRMLWTQDEVTFHGTYFTLEGVRPHLRPVQDPLPIWIGAHSLAGAKRVGRYGDGYACPPETPVEEVRERYRVVAEGFAERGKPFSPQPLRRNVLVADSKQEALAEYARVAQGRYITYLNRGLDVMAGTDLDNDFAKAVESHAVVGTPDEVTAALVDLVTQLPVDPLLVRPQWPTMDADETVAAIRRLGRDVVPTIRAIPPRTIL
ncbi:MAG: LLM class flavin-dependent oxidoreductase [Frankiales bacterium]|nr:LLM class flavin-dependent oxidoreductase [Frankiales bacterium]